MDMVKLAYELRLLLYRIYNGMFYPSDSDDVKDFLMPVLKMTSQKVLLMIES